MRETARVVALVVVFAAGVAAQQNDTRSAVPVPSCPWPCSDYHQPVCGNNGKTYANPCRLHEAAACENPCIKQMSVGPCEISCPELCIEVYQPVCGSDGRTYGNTCHLAIARCEDPCIEFMHNGECGGPCPRICTKDYKPVCGSNSRTYHNLCALNSATVCDDPCISLRNEGPCVHNCGDPCPHPVSDELVCGRDGTTYLSQCHLEEAACNNPCLTVVHGGACGGGGGGGGGEPGCHSICPKYHDPVCGSNSKTYNNLCELNNAQRCESRCITLRAKGNCAHICGDLCLFSDEGVCGTDGNTYPNQCVLEEAACHNPCLAVRHQGPCKDQECPRICTQNYKPVCGSNSKTYHNLCALNSAAECDDPCITLRNEGPCEHTCGEPCPLIIDQQLAVCGSDGTTYSSRCHLEEAACHQPCLTVQHTGPCDSEGCHIVCPLHVDPVCGTDGKTYGNMCALSAAIRCNNDPCLTLRAVGPCQRKCGDPCPIFEHHAPVCGSDGITYPSQCHLEEAACHNPCLVVEHQSQCDNQPCPRNCPLFFDLVCGTDGITYMNQCTLNNASLCMNNCIGLRGKGPCTRECGDPCPMPQLPDAVCSSDGTTYPSQCHLDEAACHNPCISTAHAGPCGSGSGKCCIKDMRTFPEINVKLSCHQGILLAEATGQIPPNPSVCRFAGHGYDLGEQLEDMCFPMTCTAEGWVPVGPISDCCAHCLLYGDLHVFTFENESYHLHDSCNYSVAQIGSSFNPPVGVFTTPVPCKENQYPCFSSTTFKNDPLTVVTILHNDIYKVNVNGVDFEVAENGVTVLENVGVNDHLPVLAWRGSCGIFLAGSSGITVLACPHRLDVWAAASLQNQLDGLCGNYDGLLVNDFQSRGGTIYTTNPWPIAFPKSWRSAMSTVFCRDLGSQTNMEDPCTAVEMWQSVYRRTCTALLERYKPTTLMLEGLIYDMKQHIENCAIDVCLMHTGGVPHQELQDWLNILAINLNVTMSLGQRRAESNDVRNGCNTVTTPTPTCTTATVTTTATITTTTTTTRTTTATTRIITTTTHTSTRISTTTTILPVTTTVTTTTTVTIPITPFPLPTITSTVTVKVTPYPPPITSKPIYNPYTSTTHTTSSYIFNPYSSSSDTTPAYIYNPYTSTTHSTSSYIFNPYSSSTDTTPAYIYKPYTSNTHASTYTFSSSSSTSTTYASPYDFNPYIQTYTTSASPYDFNPYIQTYTTSASPYDFDPYLPNPYGISAHKQYTNNPYSVGTYTTPTSSVYNPYVFNPYVTESTSNPYEKLNDPYVNSNPSPYNHYTTESSSNPYELNNPYLSPSPSPYNHYTTDSSSNPYEQLNHPYSSPSPSPYNPYISGSSSPPENPNPYSSSGQCERKLCPYKCVLSHECNGNGWNESYWCSNGCVCCL